MEVWARDPDGDRPGKLTVVEAQCVLRESGVGTWRMTVDETAQWSPKVAEGWGVVVVDAGAVLFSGPITELGYVEQNSTRSLELSGATDMCVLEDRQVYPDPSKGYNAQTLSHYTAKGPAETLILDLVRGQCLPDPAWPTAVRTTPGLVLPASQGRGAVTSVAARFTLLLGEVQTLATVGGLVVDVVQSGRDRALQIRQPVDRSRSVRFQKRAGLDEYQMNHKAPTVTTVILGAQGEGAARTITGRSAPADPWGRRIERFEDRRDTDDADEHAKTMTEALAEGAASAGGTFTVTETPTRRFGRHYHLGDVVTVVLPGGGEITDGVRAVEITWNPHGRVVEPTIGAPGTEPIKTPAGVKKTRDLLRRVRRQETSL